MTSKIIMLIQILLLKIKNNQEKPEKQGNMKTPEKFRKQENRENQEISRKIRRNIKRNIMENQ